MDCKELLDSLEIIEKEKGIPKETIFEAIETSLVTACKKNYGTSQNIKVDMNRETGEIKVFAQKEVVEDVYDAFLEVSLEDAQEINPMYELGDFVDFEITPKNLVEFLLRQQSRLLFRSLEKLKEKKCTTNFLQRKRKLKQLLFREQTARAISL